MGAGVYLVHSDMVALRKAGWKSGELRLKPRGLCMLRLTLGLVRKSAVSGNSTGEERGSREDEVGPAVAGLCRGDARGA